MGQLRVARLQRDEREQRPLQPFMPSSSQEDGHSNDRSRIVHNDTRR